MTYGDTLSKTIKVLGFNQQAMIDLSNKESATGHGFLTLAIIGLIYGIAELFNSLQTSRI